MVGMSADRVGEKGLVVQVRRYIGTQEQMWRLVCSEAERASESPVGDRRTYMHQPLSRSELLAERWSHGCVKFLRAQS
jgi:hypothetical protein